MRTITVGVAALNQTPFDWEHNRDNILAAIEDARQAGVGLLCLPELCITGYGCEDMFHARALHERAMRVLLEEIRPRTHGLVVSVGLPVFHLGAVYNTAALLCHGKVLGFVAKQHLAGEGIHYEPRWFQPWPVGVRTTLHVGNEAFPIGDVHFELGGVRLGFEICEDAWVAQRPGGRLSQQGVDILLNPSASHFAFGKQEVRRRFVLEGSRAFGTVFLYANLLGNEAGRAIFDGSTMIASCGQMLAEGTRFSFRDRTLLTAVVDVDGPRTHRIRNPSFKSVSAVEEGACVRVSHHWSGVSDEHVASDASSDDRKVLSQFPPPPSSAPSTAPRAMGAPFEASPRIKEEEFARAVALGLFDYLRKSRSQGYVVSLSGGADSAAVACLVGLMVRFGELELGLHGVTTRLGHVAGLDTAANVREVTKRLLSTAYQSTKNSSQVTRQAARGVAVAIGADHHEWDVDALVEAYRAMLESSLSRKLTWERDDLALQNVQARVRGPSVWMLANVRGAILLATSNRSEAAVGYATMDGDTCGGLSPIAGIDKAFLRRWLRWLEVEGPVDLEPIDALHAVNVQAPTAELRPSEAGQTDEQDLMPYPVLDVIEREAILDKRSPAEVLIALRTRFPNTPAAQLRAWVERFFVLFTRNQWKRERYAPSFHVDDESLDPKTWCRFPILSGGFKAELQELKGK